MDANYKRKISEVEALFEVEPDIKSLFTEGPEDAIIFDLFLGRNQISDVHIYSIDTISFSENSGSNLRSNKDKVLFLAQKVYSTFGDSLSNFICVVDRDFDTILDNFIENPYLLYTDFANLEMYLFNKESIDKFLKIGIKNFPLTSGEVIIKLQTALLDLYSIRYARNEVKKSLKLLKLDKLFKFQKGVIIYDPEEILNKFLSKNNFLHKEKVFKSKIKLVSEKYNELNEARFFMHGKDFFELFFLLIKKIKNTYSFNIDSFTRSFFSSIEIESLKKYNLFVNLEQIFKG